MKSPIRLIAFAGVLLSLLLPAAAFAAESKPCDASATLASYNPKLDGKSVAMPPSTCTSLGAVIKRLFAGSKAGGKKLENDKPLNVAAAEQERQKAKADPEFSQLLSALLAAESDPQRRLLLEAAVLDDFGYYQARDLLLKQLADQLGVAK